MREWGVVLLCNKGSSPDDLEDFFKTAKINFDLVQEGWEEGKTRLQDYHRGVRVLHELWAIGNIARKPGGGEWEGIKIPGVKKLGQDVEIVLVSHGGFLETLEGFDCTLLLLSS